MQKQNIHRKKYAEFTPMMMRAMLDTILAIPRKKYPSTRAWPVKRLYRFEILMLCFLWQYGYVPTIDELNSMEIGRIIRLFTDELKRRGITCERMKCQTTYDLAHDITWYKLSCLRFKRRGILMLLQIPTQIEK